MGHKTEARIISRLAKETAAQPRDTKAQQQFDTALNNGMTAEKLIQNLKHQLDESEQFSNLARKLSESGHKAEAKLMQDIPLRQPVDPLSEKHQWNAAITNRQKNRPRIMNTGMTG